MSDGALPLAAGLVEGEPALDVVDDLTQGALMVGGVGDGHADESDVAVGWLAFLGEGLLVCRLAVEVVLGR